jgi:hypothetical protein
MVLLRYTPLYNTLIEVGLTKLSENRRYTKNYWIAAQNES